MNPPDVPSPIDLKDELDAREWERTAMQRPYREEFFAAFHQQLVSLGDSRLAVLELGSGPGFLAHHILSRTQGIDYTLLDFSSAMHELAKRRLETVEAANVQYVQSDFKAVGWSKGLGQYDAILSNQAVHELRHKRYAPGLFLQLRELLRPTGMLLFCDHYFGVDGMGNDQLYMSLEEQRKALTSAGFAVSVVLVKGGRALYRATPSSIGSAIQGVKVV